MTGQKHFHSWKEKLTIYTDNNQAVVITTANKKRGKMKTWYIWGINLPKIEIKANSFDNAIAQARKVNKNYNTGQLK